MNATQLTASMRITPPADFPVSWKQPEDDQYHWTRDHEHLPEPITPMFASVSELTATEGYARTVPVYDRAIIARIDRTINTYEYIRLVHFDGAPKELAARAQRSREKIAAATTRLADIWENEWRPEIEAMWAFWQSFDLDNADMPALCAHLESSLARATRLYELHYLIGPPMWFAINEFETIYCDLFPNASRLDAHRLLQGFDNKTLEIGRALWQLSRLAQASPVVYQALIVKPAAQALAALKEAGQTEFLGKLEAFLAAYGHRSSLWDWGYPSWADDPTPVINNLKNYVTQPDRDLLAELAAAAAEREEAIAQAHYELRGYPRPVRERFDKLLKAAQLALVLTENHTYYMDFNGFGWVHRVIREFGKRFATAGRLDQVNDVFYLSLQELRQMMAAPSLNLAQLAAARRIEAERWASYSEPPELGARPETVELVGSADERRMMRYVGRLYAAAPQAPSDSDTLRGQAGSAGKARGPARLILSLAEAHRLQPGDILVTTTTAPPWTPLFLTAAAIVTDAGGLLSHGAVVSREYHIPAVVGTRNATARITDGQMIQVDGDNGIVRLS